MKIFFGKFFFEIFFIVRLGMLESSGLRRYSTLLVIQLFSRRLCLCYCLCIRLCLCLCIPNSFLNSYYHKLSENVTVWGSGASRSGGGEDVTKKWDGRTDNNRTRKDRATQPLDYGRLRWAISIVSIVSSDCSVNSDTNVKSISSILQWKQFMCWCCLHLWWYFSCCDNWRECQMNGNSGEFYIK